MSFRYRLNFGNGQVGSTRDTKREVLSDYNRLADGYSFVQAEYEPYEWRRVSLDELRKGRTVLASEA